MYGMVNRAAQEFIVERYGVESWLGVKTRAGIDSEGFDRLEQYPDQLTYDIVESASAVLSLSADEFLERFGKFWIRFAARSGYEAMFEMAGQNLFDFLGSLDELHTRLSFSFPDYQPPSFYCTDYDGSSVRLHYVSEREGLAPFVIGLVKGLGELFETPVDLIHENRKNGDSDHDVFLVRKHTD